MAPLVKALALIDGEHYAPVVRAALEELPYEFVAAHLLGGTEKLREGAEYGVPLAATLDGALADHVRRDEVVRQLLERCADDRRVVLAVDDRERSHERVVTSSSILPVYFSYSNVSSENWMIRSWPWNGCLRQTATWLPVTSTTL